MKISAKGKLYSKLCSQMMPSTANTCFATNKFLWSSVTIVSSSNIQGKIERPKATLSNFEETLIKSQEKIQTEYLPEHETISKNLNRKLSMTKPDLLYIAILLFHGLFKYTHAAVLWSE